MPSLKSLKSSIASTQSTKRITSAMKMVAAAKLKRATDSFENASEYCDRMEQMLTSAVSNSNTTNPLFVEGKNSKRHLVLVLSSDRGLCGGFNGNLISKFKAYINQLTSQGKDVKILVIGRKAKVGLTRHFRHLFVEVVEELNKPKPEYAHAEKIADMVLGMYEKGEFDTCSIFYNKFTSVLEQTPSAVKLIPATDGHKENKTSEDNSSEKHSYECEPSFEGLLLQLFPTNFKAKVFLAMLESFAGEQGARMTAMDNATRNASDLIKELSVEFNRTRQSQITNELIEIISGANAL